MLRPQDSHTCPPNAGGPPHGRSVPEGVSGGSRASLRQASAAAPTFHVLPVRRVGCGAPRPRLLNVLKLDVEGSPQTHPQRAVLRCRGLGIWQGLRHLGRSPCGALGTRCRWPGRCSHRACPDGPPQTTPPTHSQQGQGGGGGHPGPPIRNTLQGGRLVPSWVHVSWGTHQSFHTRFRHEDKLHGSSRAGPGSGVTESEELGASASVPCAALQ